MKNVDNRLMDIFVAVETEILESDDRLMDLLVEIETEILENLDLPRGCMSFDFSIIKGAEWGNVLVDTKNFHPTDDQIYMFKSEMLKRLW